MNLIKKIEYLFLFFPFLDLITALFIKNFNLAISPGIVIKGLFIILVMLYIIISKSKYKKISLTILISCLIYILLYFLSKQELLQLNFIFSELTYIFKLVYFPIVFSGLLCFYDEHNLDIKHLLKTLFITLLIYTLMLIIPFILGNAHNTYLGLLKGKIGWFYSGNEISCILIILLSFSFYILESTKKYSVLIFIPILFIVFQIGTKVSFLGTIIIMLLLLILGSINSFKNTNFKFIKYVFIFSLTIFYSFFSVTVQNYRYLSENNISESTIKDFIIIDDKNKLEIENIRGKITDFYDKNQFNKVFKSLLSSRDIYLANTLSIYNKDLTNDNIWFGIGFSNTEKVNNTNIQKLIEIDILDGFFHYGIFGLLIMISPFLISLYLIFNSKKRLTLESVYYGLIILLVCGISTFSGHVLTAPAVSLYLILYLLLLLNEFKIFDRNVELKDKISILSLHLGYGGIERAIVNQANMLCDSHDVEIICLYKLLDDIPYELDKRVKIKYLSDLKPNKQEFIKYMKEKNIIKIISEGFKSINILYQKHSLVRKYIYKSDSKIIISTRLDFTRLLNNYGNKEIIKIAEEHVYHHNNKKYFKKLKSSLTNINYLLPTSNYLTEDYTKIFKKEKVTVKYIPNIVSGFPTKVNKCNNKNIISVGRFSPEKGYKDLIEIYKQVKKQNSNIKLTLVGDGPEMDDLKELIKKEKLNIKLTGFLNQEELKKEYSNASLFVMTSYEESFGLVLIEAMSYGIPCFAFDSALGAKEIINNKNGVLIKNRNEKQMVKEIIKYFKNNPDKNMIKEARTTSERYSFEQVKILWEEFIEEILNHNSITEIDS